MLIHWPFCVLVSLYYNIKQTTSGGVHFFMVQKWMSPYLLRCVSSQTMMRSGTAAVCWDYIQNVVKSQSRVYDITVLHSHFDPKHELPVKNLLPTSTSILDYVLYILRLFRQGLNCIYTCNLMGKNKQAHFPALTNQMRQTAALLACCSPSCSAYTDR